MKDAGDPILRLATRGSRLALWQAERTREALAAAGIAAELVVIESGGDRDRTTDLARFGSIGIFTVEVDRAVLDGRADVGVHSMKDMTTTLQGGVVLAGCLERGMVEDVLVARDGRGMDALAPGARVGSGSLRRGAMLRRVRPDLEVVPIRGNVPTRIAKVTSRELEATVLARAGMVRLGLEHHATEVLDSFVPAVGQGIVGLTCRGDDATTRSVLDANVRNADAWWRGHAERAFLRAIQGGCNAPVGGHATIESDRLYLRGIVLAMDGSRAIEGETDGPLNDVEALGESLADSLLSQGAGELIAAARESNTRP